MVVFAALHMGWLKFLAVFLEERRRKKRKMKIKIKKKCVQKYYCMNNLLIVQRGGFEAAGAVADTALLWPDVISSL